MHVCASVCDMCASGFACAHVSVHACLSVYMDAHVCVLSAHRQVPVRETLSGDGDASAEQSRAGCAQRSARGGLVC